MCKGDNKTGSLIRTLHKKFSTHILFNNHFIYFASLKDRIGCSEESIDLPEGVASVESLIAHLSTLHGEQWSSIINGSTVLIAVNHEMSDRSAPVKEGDEVAFFPPVTGG